MNLRILIALTEIYDLEGPRLATVDYLVEHGIDINRVAGFCGSPTVAPITLLPNQCFDFPDHGAGAVESVVIEARGEDGETLIDLVAWPVADPSDVRTLLGVAPILGLWAAHNSATYIFGRPLVLSRTPLEWLQAGCTGSAVAVPDLATRIFLDIADIGGRIGASDHTHQRELKGSLQDMIRRVEIVSPKPDRGAA